MASTLILPPTQTISNITSAELWNHIETLTQGANFSDTVTIYAVNVFFGAVTAPQWRRAVYSGHIWTITNSSGVPLAYRRNNHEVAVEYGILESGHSLSSAYWSSSSSGSLDLTPYFSFTCQLA